MKKRSGTLRLWLCFCGRTRSWSVPTSMTTTATSPTAPSAVEAGRCSCVATTTAVGQYLTVCMCECVVGRVLFLVARTGFRFHIDRNNLPINVKTWWAAPFIGNRVSRVMWSRFIYLCRYKVYFGIRALTSSLQTLDSSTRLISGVLLWWKKCSFFSNTTV